MCLLGFFKDIKGSYQMENFFCARLHGIVMTQQVVAKPQMSHKFCSLEGGCAQDYRKNVIIISRADPGWGTQDTHPPPPTNTHAHSHKLGTQLRN